MLASDAFLPAGSILKLLVALQTVEVVDKEGYHCE